MNLSVSKLATLVFFIIVILSTNGICQSTPDIAENVGQSVVMIVTYDAAGSPEAQGSGVFLTEEGVILTNAHVLEKAYSAGVISDIGSFDEVSILYKDEDKDLALIWVATDSARAPEIARGADLRPGQRVIAIGNPLGLEKTISDGLISGIRRENGIELIQTSVPISPGSSGGVLLNEQGEIIGITTASYSEGQNINFAISINTIVTFLEYYGTNKAMIKAVSLKPAGQKVLYRVVLKWLGNIILFILSFVFGGAFYIVIPILIIIGSMLYWLIRKIVEFVKLIIRKARNIPKSSQVRSNMESIQEHALINFKDGQENIFSNEIETSDNAASDEMIIFYCWKCGELIDFERKCAGDEMVCPNCGSPVTVPNE